MKIKFVHLSHPFSDVKNGQTISSKASIQLAGKSTIYKLDLKVSDFCHESMTLKGSKQICFSDFGLIAPSKMGGLVKVNDFIEVAFIFHLNKIQ